ncbi:MAG: carboxypeptidase regulatory-like domain-containing protein [Rhodothermaceae bacterium]|nr:carboxypeptidase regulatory-like domain-containing protein [Rhodothermaceae bacterium]MYE63868.1 carboxypeptidase regulatory-like domain-containing protein [Rhodothermaceae bacterium]MYJ20270.1 carboxypeptidase regulatory-like domain-containing protein [Rhodothermaceae bacterium]
MRWTFLLLPLFLCEMAYGQNFSVTGSVTDSTGKALVNASIVVITQVDSSLVGFSTSRSDGYFKVDQLSPGSYILQVSFVGYETLGGILTLWIKPWILMSCSYLVKLKYWTSLP